MKITGAQVVAVSLPRDTPPNQGVTSLDMPVVAVTLQTDAGIEGLGYTLALMPEYAGSLARMVEELSGQLIGMDPLCTEQVHAKMIYPANWFGPGGMLNIAAAALDIACWDIAGKAAGLPLWKLLGGFSNHTAVYDSGSLISNDSDVLRQRAATAVAKGHRAIKMRPGLARFGNAEQLRRHVGAVREAIGPDVQLMLDVNQTWTAPRAIEMARALAEFDLAWIEDPVAMHDVAGQAAVAAALDTPICSGEYHYNAPPLLRLLQEQAVDYLMVDLLRMGGITQFRKVAGLAEAFGIPVASHLIPEVFGHCIAAIPNGLITEGMPWTEMLFTGGPQFREGRLYFDDRPGHGLVLDQDIVKRYRIDQ